MRPRASWWMSVRGRGLRGHLRLAAGFVLEGLIQMGVTYATVPAAWEGVEVQPSPAEQEFWQQFG